MPLLRISCLESSGLISRITTLFCSLYCINKMVSLLVKPTSCCFGYHDSGMCLKIRNGDVSKPAHSLVMIGCWAVVLPCEFERWFILVLWRIKNAGHKKLGGNAKADKRGLPAICLWWKHGELSHPVNMQTQHVLMKNEIALQAFQTRLSSFDGIHYNRPTVPPGTKKNHRYNNNLKVRETRNRQRAGIQKETVFVLQCSPQIFVSS